MCQNEAAMPELAGDREGISSPPPYSSPSCLLHHGEAMKKKKGICLIYTHMPSLGHTRAAEGEAIAAGWGG